MQDAIDSDFDRLGNPKRESPSAQAGITVQIGFAPEDAIHMVLALASGALAEAEVADWFRARKA